MKWNGQFGTFYDDEDYQSKKVSSQKPSISANEDKRQSAFWGPWHLPGDGDEKVSTRLTKS